MQPGRFGALIQDVLNLPLQERDRELGHEIGRIRVQYRDRPREALRGMSVAAARYHIDSRARLILQAATSVIQRAGATRDVALAEEVRSTISTLVEAQAARLMTILRDCFGDEVEPETGSFLAAAKDQARDSAAQVELFIARLPQPPVVSVNRESPVFNFNAPVGAVQTGDHATALVNQNTVPTEVAAAMETLASHFRSRSTEEAREAVVVLTDINSELRSPNPNRLRLAGAAAALAGLVQTIASLDPAFTTLKSFLRGIGIHVP